MIGGWFASGHELHGFDLPNEGTPMVLRFYDGRSLATSTHYNALANGTIESDWTMANPGGNHVSIEVGGGQWEGGPASEFRTTIPLVPGAVCGVAYRDFSIAVAAALFDVARPHSKGPKPLLSIEANDTVQTLN
jgi:hypothetical protein